MGVQTFRFFFFFFPFFFNRRSLGFLDCFTGQSPGIGRNELAISIPARSCHELGQLMDSLMIHLEQVGLLLNAE